jgi:hypothetical protein
LWSKQSDSVVENSLMYLMNQNAALNFLKLPTFSQDTIVHTNVSKSNEVISFVSAAVFLLLSVPTYVRIEILTERFIKIEKCKNRAGAKKKYGTNLPTYLS